MKKILTILPAVALLLLLAAPADAWMRRSNDELKVYNSNSAMVIDTTTANASTGGNKTMFNGGSFSGNIATGAAGATAGSELGVNENYTSVSAPCNCYDDVTVKSRNNAFVIDTTTANASTGGNLSMMNGGYRGFGSGNIATGPAGATAVSWAAVNSNVTVLGPSMPQ